jgi:heme-degrading monooxygenase HmoA
MIARLWRGSTPEVRSSAFHEYMIRTGVRDCRGTPGNLGVLILKRTDGTLARFCFVSFWESLDAVRRFAGADESKPVLHPEDRDYLVESDEEVLHYEVSSYPPELLRRGPRAR